MNEGSNAESRGGEMRIKKSQEHSKINRSLDIMLSKMTYKFSKAMMLDRVKNCHEKK